MSSVAGLWRRAWRRAPRRLHIGRLGQGLILTALGTGVVAIRSGNNVLFLLLGAVLGAMVVSGLMSEATLRPLGASVDPPQPLRAGVLRTVLVHLRNSSRIWPIYATELILHLEQADGTHVRSQAPAIMRLGAGESLLLHVPILVTVRGKVSLTNLEAQTGFPFGFFIKRRFLPLTKTQVWAWPKRTAVREGAQALIGNAGELPAQRSGDAEDFFSLRPMRDGDDPRRIVWRRLARTGRAFVVEHEAKLARHFMLVLRVAVDAAPAVQEEAIAQAAGLAEQLLSDGCGLGLLTHGTFLPVRGGPEAAHRQTEAILTALARLDVNKACATSRASGPWHDHVTSICLQGPGFSLAEAYEQPLYVADFVVGPIGPMGAL